MTKILVIDTETGGVDPLTHSLLSLAGVVWEDGVGIAEIALDVLEDPLVVTGRAMEINRIDLGAHAKSALPSPTAARALRSFVEQHFSRELRDGGKVPIAGHNVGFDIGFLKRLGRVSGVELEDIFSHRTLDTAGIVRFLALAQVLPLSDAGSSEAFDYFGISIPEGDRHTALGDARATARLLTCLVSLDLTAKRHRDAAA